MSPDYLNNILFYWCIIMKFLSHFGLNFRMEVHFQLRNTANIPLFKSSVFYFTPGFSIQLKEPCDKY